jgi:hypothetical protein
VTTALHESRPSAPRSTEAARDYLAIAFGLLWVGLLRLALVPYVGWALVLVVAAILTAVGVFMIGLGSAIGELGMDVLVGAWVCVGVEFALLRRNLRKPRPSWDQLAVFGRIGRVLITTIGTGLFLSPFAWIAWLIVAR